MPLTHLTHHADEAVQALPGLLRDKPCLVALLRALAAEVQEVEDAVVAWAHATDPDTAVGTFLDQWGRAWGILRGGLADEPYRKLIAAERAAGVSDGAIDTIIHIVRLIHQAGEANPSPCDIRYDPAYPAGFMVTLTHDTPLPAPFPVHMAQLLTRAAPAGVAVAAVESADGPWFAWGFADDTSTPPFPGAAGFDLGKFARAL